MGQNHTKEDWLSYDSEQFFHQQIEFYKWRSNTEVNAHICRVKFQLQESIQDKQKLRIFLQQRFQECQYISLNQILQLAQTKNKKAKEELMNFQNYVCTLYEFQQKFTLTQTLYALYILFSGYEVLYTKLGKLKVKLIYEKFDVGQIKITRVMMQLKTLQNHSKTALSQKIVELGEKLVSNHTEYLHFSRQFRSYMQRDILQNWNFSNARKLINSYAYTYKINLPTNLKQQVKRRIQSIPTTSISINYYSHVHSANSSFKASRNEFLSTGEAFPRKQHTGSNPSSCRKENQQRPISLSDYSGKKSEENLQNLQKMHSKKFSSIDLKNVSQRAKQFQSPKMSRSELVANASKQQIRMKAKQSVFKQSPTQETTLKMRRQRQFAFVGQSPETKDNSTQLLTPNCHSNSFTHQPNDSKIFLKGEQSKMRNKQNGNNSILKQNQVTKQKKKLEKKATAVSKYITFYQQNKNLDSSEISNSSVREEQIEQLNQQQKINISPSPSYINMSKKSQIHQEQLTKQDMFQRGVESLKKKSSHLVSPGNEVTFQHFQCNASEILPSRGKTQHLKTWQNNNSYASSHNSSSQQRMCQTIKTLNKLVNNSDVSLHQSNGSFSSSNQSIYSQYKGVLAKMARSVDVFNVPSNKNVQTNIKKTTTNSHLNRSINS